MKNRIKKLMNSKTAARVLAVQMIFCMLIGMAAPAFASVNTITVSSKEDFVRFAKNCTLDTWSQGKTVNLACDIDLSGEKFTPVATFGGTFNGNGHTVSGISFDEKGSYQGLFRYIQQGGRVSNLNVEGKLTPGGSKSFIGGIAGENSGVVENCSFAGKIKGENVIGGIAGENTDYGQIVSCTVFGNISGENSTGGIAGKNSGLIRDCTNNAVINTVYEEKESSIDDIDTDTEALIEIYKSLEEENEEESVFGHTDTGGIVGYSSGIVQGCTNNADVGYQHVGYNVGGIAGRQSGYMLGCENYGYIQGRKDVGGIVGQAEPYILLDASESTLRDLRTELNNLSNMVNQFITDTDNLGDETEKYLDNLSKYADDASENAEILIDEGTDFLDDNISVINAETAILSNTLDKLEAAFDELEAGGKELAAAVDALIEAFKNIKIDIPELYDEIDEIFSPLTDISSAEKSLKQSLSKAERAEKNLKAAVTSGSTADAKRAAAELSAALKETITSQKSVQEALLKIEEVIGSNPESFEKIGINANETAEILSGMSSSLALTVESLKNIDESVVDIEFSGGIDFSEFTEAAQAILQALGSLDGAADDIADKLAALANALKNSYDGFIESENAAEVVKGLADCIKHLSYAADDVKSALNEIKDIVGDLADKKPMKFKKLGKNFKNASEGLFDSLSGISGELDGLRDTLSTERKKLSGDLSSINNQFNLIMNMLIDEFERLEDGADALSDIVVDVSDEDIENTRLGKVADCRNYGEVCADRNTGGIIGAMAIEYAKDPEDEIEKPNTLNFTYRTKAIVQSCINDGEIVGKKDCTGGIVGLSEIGTVYECQNYADIESTDGKYAGGIVGKSEASIRKSYAKSKVSGERYVGGIAGKAGTITASYAIANVSGDENIGAICGAVESNDELYRNYYVDSGLGAVDGISYSGKAEPIEFDELKNINGIPKRFISFTVTFVADDKIVETQDVRYGDDTARIKYPEIPSKKGHFGNWQEIEADTITENIEVLCEYQPYITVLASAEKNESGKLALALAEGEFTDKAELHAYDSSEPAPVKADGAVKVYDISLSNTDVKDDESVTIRVLNENKDKVTAWRLNNGNWEKVKASNNGKYVILHGEGTKNTICLKYEERSPIVILAVLAILLAAVLLGVLKFRRHKPV